MINQSALSLRLLALASTALVAVGCGDGPTCPSELVLVIQSPSDGSTLSSATDQDPTSAGVQIDIAVRSNFKAGDELTLTVTDGMTGAVAQYDSESNSSGDASFAGVTLPAGPVTLLAEGSSKCGTASDESEITVVGDALCSLTIDNGPIANDFYAPIPVLNASNDDNSSLANFQANLSVQSAAGFTVEVFVLDLAVGTEASIGTAAADGTGLATFDTTLSQGTQVIRATCISGGASAASAANTVLVDTVAPTCLLTNPVVGVSVTPDDDEDGNDANGIQMTWTGSVADDGEGDIEGEPASFFRDTTEYAGSVLDASGASSTALAEFTAPGDYEVSFEAQDHAANSCDDGFTARVIMDGCAIAVVQPTGAGTTNGTITADSDGIPANGLQANITVQVDTDCAGRTVFLDCGEGETSATAPANGTTVISNVTLNTAAASEGVAACTARVINVDNFQTSNQGNIAYDTLAPGILLDFIAPADLVCGDTLVFNDANDLVDGSIANGFQIRVSSLAGGAVSREYRILNSACAAPNGCVTPDAGGAGTVLTLELGDNDVQAVALDAFGNQGFSGACNIGLADIAVTFDPPVSTGVLTSNAGPVNGGNLELVVCGTVSDDTATLTVALDGGAPAAATVSIGGAWCTNAPVVFSEGPHSLVASASAPPRMGSATRNLDVDLTAPNTPTGLISSAPNRHTVAASWSAQGDATAFMFRVSETAFVDFPNEGIEVTVGAATSGAATQLDIGRPYFVGVASVDDVGNVSAPALTGPFIPLLDTTGGLFAPNLDGNEKRLGYDVASADFDGDGFDDLAVSAPGTNVGGVNFSGAVHVYLGSANGIGATPDLTISGAADGSEFGWGLTAINWGGGTQPGLAIGAPFSNGTNGNVFVFHDDTLTTALQGAGTLNVGDADITIGSGGGWFTVGAIGASLSAGDLDGAGREELIIGAVLGGGAAGGVAVIYGEATMPTSILLSDLVDPGVDGYIFQNPEATANGGLLGFQVEYLGDTRTGNGVGDFSVSYLADAVTGINDRVFVLRGRATPTANSGMTFTTLGVNDLTVELAASATGSNEFGQAMGSILLEPNDGFRDILISKGAGTDSRLFIIDGAAIGTLSLSNASGFLTTITPASGTSFATGVANNALASSPDINNDGFEDLLVVGGNSGVGDGIQLHVWLSADIPTIPATSATATHQIAAPASFTGVNNTGAKLAREVHWVGDTNNDGLNDICWADYRSAGASTREGSIEVLWDDGI